MRALDATPGNLRPAVTSFIGREAEVAEVEAAVRAHRLVTLIGVGGVGKTRLAVEVAGRLADEFPDGVWVFELAAVTDPAAVPDAVAAVLGITQQPGKSVSESVAAALEGRVRLLVFDNCEHVRDAAADLVDAILVHSATVTILATSREGLGVADEQLWLVPSLDVGAGIDSAAVNLFVERARSVASRFSLGSSEEAAAVVEICRRLDGIPLAIELAASRMASMTPIEVRDRLDQRFRLLIGSRRGLERHQTLRHAVAWSYEHLDEPEKALLERCSVFAGGFDLESACAVAGSDDLDDFAVLDLLDALVRKSLLVADRSAGRTRFSMLETVRQFAEEQLVGHGAATEVRAAHAVFAAHAILDKIVGMDEVLATIDTFSRWRYVLAIIAATAEPTRADTVMAALAGWNPGAASWVIDETRAGGLTRTFPDVGPRDWEAVGHRIRTATQAWLHGLGPLAQCFWATRAFDIGFDDVAVAVGIGDHGTTVWWLLRFEIPDQPLAPVVEDSVLRGGEPRRSLHMVSFQARTAINGTWEITRDLLASDLTTSFTARALEIGRQHHGVASEEARVYNAAMNAMRTAPPGFTGNLDIERLYPAADIQPSPTHPFCGYTTATMYRYAIAVIDAAMRCYLELSTWVTPRFDRTLGVRGLMPAEFFGTMFYSPDREHSPYDFFGPHEPGFSWLFRPLGPTLGDIDPDDNRISLTINDDARSDEMTKDKTRLYIAFRRYIEANPVYEPFARPFTSTHGRMHIFHRTPATRLAIRWLWEDLEALGFLKGTPPHDI